MGQKITVSSGNLYADMGYADAEKRQAKADQAIEIHRFMQREQVPAMAVAQWLRISESDVDNILHGDFDKFTIDQLTQFVTDLHHNAKTGSYFDQTSVMNSHVMRQPNSEKKPKKSFVDLVRGRRLLK